MNRVERALSWGLRPGGLVCAADSLCGVRQAMTPSWTSVFSSVTQDLWIWVISKVPSSSVYGFTCLSTPADQSHPHSTFLSGAYPFKANCRILESGPGTYEALEYSSEINQRQQNMQVAALSLWLLAPGFLPPGRCSLAAAVEYRLWIIVQKSNSCEWER